MGKIMKWDAFFIWGLSFSLLLLPVGAVYKLNQEWLLILISYPHFVATYALWGQRVRNWKEEWLPMAFPFVFLMVLQLTSSMADDFWRSLPYKLTYLYLLYHFALQIFGAALWGGYRGGFAVSARTKHILRAWFLLLPACSWYQQELLSPVWRIFYFEVSAWSIPAWGLTTLLLAVWGGLGVLTVSLFLDYRQAPGRGILWIFAVAIVPVLWFLPPFQRGEWLPLLPLLHAAQYLPFWRRLLWPDTQKPQLAVRALTYGGFMLVGWLLFRAAPLQLAVPWLGVQAMSMWIAMLNAHHFVIDGRIWKLSDQKNRALFS